MENFGKMSLEELMEKDKYDTREGGTYAGYRFHKEDLENPDLAYRWMPATNDQHKAVHRVTQPQRPVVVATWWL